LKGIIIICFVVYSTSRRRGLDSDLVDSLDITRGKARSCSPDIPKNHLKGSEGHRMDEEAHRGDSSVINGIIKRKKYTSVPKKENYDGAPRKPSPVLYLRQARRYNEKSDSRHKSGPSRGRAIGLVLLVNIHRSLPYLTMAGPRVATRK